MRNALKALGLAAVTTWVYAPCLRGTWLWDDGLEVAQNPVVRSASGWWIPWVHPQGMDYFPLKSSVQWLEWHLWGQDTLGYHVLSLALHVAGALLVWRLVAADRAQDVPFGDDARPALLLIDHHGSPNSACCHLSSGLPQRMVRSGCYDHSGHRVAYVHDVSFVRS